MSSVSNSPLPSIPTGFDHRVSAGQSSERPKRKTSSSLDPSMHDDRARYENYPGTDSVKPSRSKRNRVARANSNTLEGPGGFADHGNPAADFENDNAGGSGQRSDGDSAHSHTKSVSEKDKDARRQARMIRNRNAAQASRDRKKEHTMYLERRVAELEAKLNGTASQPFTASSFPIASDPTVPPSKLARSQRSASIVSSISSTEGTRATDLEEENQVLRSQLHLEQTESAQLRARLLALEHQLSTYATSSLRCEPTFAFDTANLKPLPQPEELQFFEARAQQKRLSPLSMTQIPLPSLPLPSSSDTSSSWCSSSSETLANLDSSRLVAAEAVQLPLSSSSSNLSSRSHESTLTRSPSLSASISSTPSIASLDLASTPPSTESYLEDLDNFVPPPMWNEWVKSDPESKEDDSAVSSGLAFVNFEFLQESPVIASC